MFNSIGIPRMTVILMCISFFIASFPFLQAQENDWVLKKELDDLTVYSRTPEDSRIKEVKIETEVRASLSTVVAVLKDIPAYATWVYKCEKSELLQKVGPTESIYYCEMDFPWPMNNRDFIAHSHLKQDPESLEVIIDVGNEPNYLPEKSGLVRIQKMKIHWRIIAEKGSKKVNIVYHLKSDPGGWMPAWLINMAIDQGPINMIQNFREMLKNEKYQNLELPFIVEPNNK